MSGTSGPVQDPSAVLHVFFAEAIELGAPPLADLDTLQQCQCHWYIGDSHDASKVFSFTTAPETAEINFRAFLVTDVGADADLKFTIATEAGEHLAVKFGRLQDLAQTQKFEVHTFELCNVLGVLTTIAIHSAVQPRWTLEPAAERGPGECVFIDPSDAQASYVVNHIFGEQAPEVANAEPVQEEEDDEEREDSGLDMSPMQALGSSRESVEVAKQKTDNNLAGADGSQEEIAPKSVADKSRAVASDAVTSEKAVPSSSGTTVANSHKASKIAADVEPDEEEGDEEGWFWEGGEEEELEGDDVIEPTDDEEVPKDRRDSDLKLASATQEQKQPPQQQTTKRGSRTSVGSAAQANGQRSRGSLKTTGARNQQQSPPSTQGASTHKKGIVLSSDESDIAVASRRSSIATQQSVAPRRRPSAESIAPVVDDQREQEALADAARVIAAPQSRRHSSSKSMAPEQPKRRTSGQRQSVEKRGSIIRQQLSESSEHELSAAQQQPQEKSASSHGHLESNARQTQKRSSGEKPKTKPETSSGVHQPFVLEEQIRVDRKSSIRQAQGSAEAERRSSTHEHSQRQDDRGHSSVRDRRGEASGHRLISRGQVAERPVSRREEVEQLYPAESSACSSSGSSSGGAASPRQERARGSDSGASASARHAKGSSSQTQDAKRTQKDMLLINAGAENGPLTLSGGVPEFGIQGEMQHRRMVLKSKMRIAKARDTAVSSQRNRDIPTGDPVLGDSTAKGFWTVDPKRGRFFRVEANAISARCRPHIDAARSVQDLLHGDIFNAISSKLSDDGFVYLQLAHNRGWVFNDARVHAVYIVDDIEEALAEAPGNCEADASPTCFQESPGMYSDDGTDGLSTGRRTAEGTPSSVTSRSLMCLQRVADAAAAGAQQCQQQRRTLQGPAPGVHQPNQQCPGQGHQSVKPWSAQPSPPQSASQRNPATFPGVAMGLDQVHAHFENISASVHVSSLNSARSLASDRIGQSPLNSARSLAYDHVGQSFAECPQGSTQALQPRQVYHTHTHVLSSNPIWPAATTGGQQSQPGSNWPEASAQQQHEAMGLHARQHTLDRAADRMWSRPSPQESGFGISPTTDGWLTPPGCSSTRFDENVQRPGQARTLTPGDVRFELGPDPDRSTPRDTRFEAQAFGEPLPGPSQRMQSHIPPLRRGGAIGTQSRQGSCSPERKGHSPHLSTSFLAALRGQGAPPTPRRAAATGGAARAPSLVAVPPTAPVRRALGERFSPGTEPAVSASFRPLAEPTVSASLRHPTESAASASFRPLQAAVSTSFRPLTESSVSASFRPLGGPPPDALRAGPSHVPMDVPVTEPRTSVSPLVQPKTGATAQGGSKRMSGFSRAQALLAAIERSIRAHPPSGGQDLCVNDGNLFSVGAGTGVN